MQPVYPGLLPGVLKYFKVKDHIITIYVKWREFGVLLIMSSGLSGGVKSVRIFHHSSRILFLQRWMWSTKEDVACCVITFKTKPKRKFQYLQLIPDHVDCHISVRLKNRYKYKYLRFNISTFRQVEVFLA